MKALVIGASGFVGGHLLRALEGSGFTVAGTGLPGEAGLPCPERYDLDILSETAILHVLGQCQPDLIFHLAAQSSVALSWRQPGQAVDINIKGSLNLLEALRKHPGTPRLLLIGSSEEYGAVPCPPTGIPETSPVAPLNVYGVSKLAVNQLGRLYAKSYHLPIISTRSFAHIGPGQAATFMVPDFCRQIARMEAGDLTPIIRVGDLSPIRDYCDVRDIVQAYISLAQKGVPGETYNVGSGQGIPLRQILTQLLALTPLPITTDIDPNKLRPAEVPVAYADIQKLQSLTHWTPQHALKDSLKDILTEHRLSLP